MIGQTLLWAPEPTLPLRRRVTVELITAAEARHALVTWHYLHRPRVGRQLNYAVAIDGKVDGVITYAYPMMSQSLDGIPSDELVEFARLFLKSNIPHTATCAIGKSLRRLRDDWTRAFPDAKPIRLVVSWSDREYHTGTIYKAANFRWLHESKGTGPWKRRQPGYGKSNHTADRRHHKDCWIYRWPSDRRKPAELFCAEE